MGESKVKQASYERYIDKIEQAIVVPLWWVALIIWGVWWWKIDYRATEQTMIILAQLPIFNLVLGAEFIVVFNISLTVFELTGHALLGDDLIGVLVELVTHQGHSDTYQRWPRVFKSTFGVYWIALLVDIITDTLFPLLYPVMPEQIMLGPGYVLPSWFPAQFQTWEWGNYPWPIFIAGTLLFGYLSSELPERHAIDAFIHGIKNLEAGAAGWGMIGHIFIVSIGNFGRYLFYGLKADTGRGDYSSSAVGGRRRS